jgi:hypothetical protein
MMDLTRLIYHNSAIRRVGNQKFNLERLRGRGIPYKQALTTEHTEIHGKGNSVPIRVPCDWVVSVVEIRTRCGLGVFGGLFSPVGDQVGRIGIVRGLAAILLGSRIFRTP